MLENFRGDLKQMYKYIVNKWKHNHFNLIQDNDDCMKEHSAVSEYWQAREALRALSTTHLDANGNNEYKFMLHKDELNTNFHT